MTSLRGNSELALFKGQAGEPILGLNSNVEGETEQSPLSPQTAGIGALKRKKERKSTLRRYRVHSGISNECGCPLLLSTNN